MAPLPQKKTYIVEETIDERNYIDNYPVRDPPPQKTYIVEKTVNERNYVNDYPVRDPPRKETYIYKETHNTTNKNYSNQPRDYPDRDTTRGEKFISEQDKFIGNNYTNYTIHTYVLPLIYCLLPFAFMRVNFR